MKFKIGDFDILRICDFLTNRRVSLWEVRDLWGTDYLGRVDVSPFQLDHPWERPPLVDTHRTPSKRRTNSAIIVDLMQTLPGGEISRRSRGQGRFAGHKSTRRRLCSSKRTIWDVNNRGENFGVRSRARVLRRERNRFLLALVVIVASRKRQ